MPGNHFACYEINFSGSCLLNSELGLGLGSVNTSLGLEVCGHGLEVCGHGLVGCIINNKSKARWYQY